MVYRWGKTGHEVTASQKIPDAALRFIVPRLSPGQADATDVKSTPHSSQFARLACGAFTKPLNANLEFFCIQYNMGEKGERLWELLMAVILSVNI
jgi:hypothetical protein